jgi:hypothetical protein
MDELKARAAQVLKPRVKTDSNQIFPVRIRILKEGSIKGRIGDYMFTYPDGPQLVTRIDLNKDMVDLVEGEFEVVSEEEYEAAQVVDG